MRVVLKAVSVWRFNKFELSGLGGAGKPLSCHSRDSMTNHFGRSRRILKTDDFSSVFRLQRLYKTRHMVLYVRPNSLPYARLGVVVAKRLAPRAVTRNAVKRAVREGFRQSELLNSLGLDCVVRLSKPLSKPSSQSSVPACSATLQAQLFREVTSLFAMPSRFEKRLEP